MSAVRWVLRRKGAYLDAEGYTVSDPKRAYQFSQHYPALAYSEPLAKWGEVWEVVARVKAPSRKLPAVQFAHDASAAPLSDRPEGDVILGRFIEAAAKLSCPVHAEWWHERGLYA